MKNLYFNCPGEESMLTVNAKQAFDFLTETATNSEYWKPHFDKFDNFQLASDGYKFIVVGIW